MPIIPLAICILWACAVLAERGLCIRDNDAYFNLWGIEPNNTHTFIPCKYNTTESMYNKAAPQGHVPLHHDMLRGSRIRGHMVQYSSMETTSNEQLHGVSMLVRGISMTIILVFI